MKVGRRGNGSGGGAGGGEGEGRSWARGRGEEGCCSCLEEGGGDGGEGQKGEGAREGCEGGRDRWERMGGRKSSLLLLHLLMLSCATTGLPHTMPACLHGANDCGLAAPNRSAANSSA